jgi:hypothetical protein
VGSDFRFYVAAQPFEKSKDGGRTLRIGGIVSTESTDQDGEKLLRRGLDFGPFENNGFFNDNHGRATTDVVGYPTGFARWVEKGSLLPDGSGDKATVSGWWVEGVLVGEKGQEIHRIARDLKGSGRSLGFSIQGSYLSRDPLDPKVVTKAVVKHIAITAVPVNSETELRLLTKALSAGSAIVNPGASAGGGFPLRRESLGSKIKVAGSPDDLLVLYARPKKKKGLSEKEGREALRRRYPNLPDEMLGKAYSFACALKARLGGAL